MKNFKKLTAAIAAALMAASLSIPMVSSAGSIKIGGPSDGYTGDNAAHTYEAYQIFSGTLSSANILSDIEWGSGIAESKIDDLIAAIKEISVDNVKPFENCEDAKTVADVLADTENDSALTKAFADTVAKYLSTEKTEIVGTSQVTVNDGYYLIQDASNSPSEADASKTRYILRVAGDAEINAKSDYPTVMKKVQEESLIGGEAETASFAGDAAYELGDGYNDIADYDIGDAVPFKLYGTLPSNYDDYKQYYYCFTDKLGSEFNVPAESDVKVYIDGAATNDFTVTITGNSIEIKCENLKNTGATKNSVITVEYTAVLNETAKIGAPGQVNDVNLTYSNNPNQESGGIPDTNTTTDDGVIVFTYGIDINKVQEDGTTKLADAKFAVYTLDGETKKFVKTTADNKFDGFTETAPNENTAVGNENGVYQSVDTEGINIVIEGLDAGTYYITELKAPDGYNKLTNDIEVTVTPTYMENRQAWTYSTTGQSADALDNAKALTNLEITNADDVSIETGKGTITIENKQGSKLPSTGGIGTTLFYLGGGCMVAIAGIFLITKKRMGKNSD